MTEFDKDIREKKQIGNSARHKVVSGGRRVGFPSDGLTKKEREALNSEVRSWNTKRVMPWGTYKQSRDIWQNELVYALGQGVRLLLTEELRHGRQ